MGVIDLHKFDDMRKQHNSDIIKRLRNGEPLKSFDSQSSWFPPRPVIGKDKRLLSKLYPSSNSSKRHSSNSVIYLTKKR